MTLLSTSQTAFDHQKKYLPHIEGLRGWAILLVVLFHYSTVRGGFVGVDIFFVISGYLITGLLVNDLEKDRFSFWEFYSKRIRRIFPALITVLVCTFALAWFFLFHDDYVDFGKHLTAASLFLTNYRLLHESGYFDVASQFKPLMHLWSLAIEEQFYLIWPFLIVGFFRQNQRRLVWAVAGLTLASFFYNIYETHNLPADFFQFPARFWEIGVGGWIAIGDGNGAIKQFFSPIYRRFFQVLGLFLVLTAAFTFRDGIAFPGWAGLVPVLGALLLVVFGGENSWVHRYLFTSHPIIFLGKISYSLYLWHWPTLSLMKIYRAGEISNLDSTVAFLFSFGAAVATYYFIERPFLRVFLPLQMKKLVFCGVCSLILLALLGLRIENLKVPERLAHLRAVPYHYTEEEKFQNCVFVGGTEFAEMNRRPCETPSIANRPKVVVIGDSHAGSLSAGLRPVLLQNDVNFIGYFAIYCPPTDLTATKVGCREFNRYVQSKIEGLNPELLIIDSNYLMWDQEWQEGKISSRVSNWMEDLGHFQSKTGIRVLVIGQIPTWANSLPAVLNNHFLRMGAEVPTRTFEGVVQDSLDWDIKLKEWAERAGLDYLSLKDILCDKHGCLVQVGPSLPHDLIVIDYRHLSTAGALYIMKHGLSQKILELL